MEALERVSILLTLIRELVAVLERENALLRAMDGDALAELQEEKAALVDAYEAEFDHLRRHPELVASLDPAQREALMEAVRELRLALRVNLAALSAARTAVERVAAHIASSLARTAATTRPLPPGSSAEVVPIAVDRCV